MNGDLISTADYLAKYVNEEYNPENSQFEILSTIRYDPNLSPHFPITVDEIKKENFFLFEEHYHRLIYTLKYFQIHLNIDSKEKKDDFSGFDVTEEYLLSCLVESIKHSESTLFLQSLKIRMLVSRTGELRIELYETPFRLDLFDGLRDSPNGDIWDVRIDSERILISPFTSFKTTNRKIHSGARERGIPGNRPGLEEVLMVNTQGLIMEGSITNIAVRRNEHWVTPLLSSGCLCGVARNYLLRKYLITEGVVKELDIRVGSEILLFNGVMGVVRGMIVQ